MSNPERPRNKRKRKDHAEPADVIFVQDNTSIVNSNKSSGAANANTLSAPDTLEGAVQRYRNWRRTGSHHDRLCFECGGNDDLLHCHTCRRSYHDHCLKQSTSNFIHNSHFFCEVCINRQWHHEAPPLSPPPSPAPIRSRIALPNQRSSTPHGVTVNETAAPLSVRRRADVAVDQHSAGVTPTILSRGSSDQQRQLQPHGDEELSTALPSNPSYRETTAPLVATGAPSITHTSLAPRPSRSRYSTMTSEVDEAISVVLRELEYMGDAKQKIRQLEELVTRLQQQVKVNEYAGILNAQILAQHRAVTDNRSNMTAEIEKLKNEVDRLNHLLAEETSQSENYKVEVQSWMVIAQKSQAELEELKAKLKSLLGE